MNNENIKHILTVISPSGSILRINGELTNKIEISENQRIEITCSKTGYKTYEQIIDSLNEDTTINIDSLELIKHNIKIVTDENNIILINDKEISELIVDEFTPINIIVKREGYISQIEQYDKITEDLIINILLEKKYHTFKIFIPEDSNINFYPENCVKQFSENNDEKYLLVTVDEFTPVNWTISKPGYKNHTVFIEKVTEDIDFDSPTLEYEIYTLIVNAGKNCKGAKLTLNDEKAVFGQLNEIGTIGSEVIVKVEKEHYITYIEKVLLIENTILTVDLEERKYTVSIENIPEDSIITYKKGNYKEDYYIEPFKVKSGSQVIITASKTDYKPFIYTIESIDKDYAIRIPIMELQKYNLTVNAPENSIIKINGTETKYFPQIFDIHSQIKIEVSKNHYITHVHEFEITEDTVYNCILNLEQYRLTVTSNPENANIIIINESEQYLERENMFDYGSEILIKAELEGYESFEKSIQILQDTTENIILSKKQVKLNFITYPESILDDALIKVDNIQISGTETNVLWGELHKLSVEKFGYKTYQTEIIPFENTIIYVNDNGKWNKPAISVNIKNIDEIKEVPVILINDKPVGNGVAIPVNYNSNINIQILTTDYFKINEDLIITEDTSLYYELVDINSGKYFISVKTDLEDAEILINDNKQHKLYVEPNTEVKIQINHNGYETLIDEFIITENIEKFYSVNEFVKKIFKCRWYTNPSNAIVKINDEIINNKYVEVPYMSELNYSVLCEKYLPESGNIIVNSDIKINVSLKQDPSFNNTNIEDIYGEGLDGIIRMIKLRSCYSYLNIGRFFNNGIDENAVRKFYELFGYYVNSRFDYLLWHKMHDYFGHINNIPEPEPDNSHQLNQNNKDNEFEIIS